MGPCRLWVDLSRRWAAAGLRCFRIDLSSLGDSPLRHPDQPRFRARGVEAFDDVNDAMRFLCADDPSDVVLVGLCSSAYQALESALESHPRGVVAVQPVLSFRPRRNGDGSSDGPSPADRHAPELARSGVPRRWTLVRAPAAIPRCGMAHTALGCATPATGRMAAQSQSGRGRRPSHMRRVGGTGHSPGRLGGDVEAAATDGQVPFRVPPRAAARAPGREPANRGGRNGHRSRHRSLRPAPPRSFGARRRHRTASSGRRPTPRNGTGSSPLSGRSGGNTTPSFPTSLSDLVGRSP